MQKQSPQRIKTGFLGVLFITAACALPLNAVDSPKDKINKWMSECPYIGLVAKETDITSLEVSPEDPESSTNHISIAALKRIYLAHQD